MFRSTLAALVALTFAATAGAQRTTLRAEVEAMHTRLTDAFRASPSSAAAFYTDSAAIVGGGMRAVGRAAVDRYWGSLTPGAAWSLEVLDVGGDPAAPWVHGRSTLVMGGRNMVTEYIGLLDRDPALGLRFAVDAYASASRAQGASAGDSIAELRRLDSAWARMYAEHDTALARQLYHPSLAFVSANGHVKTLADEMADVRPAPGLRMEYFRTEPRTVQAFGNVAVVEGIADWRYTANERPRDVRRRYTAVYVRGGTLGWRIIAMRMGAAPGE